jgi:flavin reductase (DIM6/NTAB) family NADH-FMN oxidoreductase RutF
LPLDPAEYRKVMSRFATGVTVVTTCVGGRFHGFTANGVTSVSLEPLLFLVCVGKSAVAHTELEQAKHFGVSMLAEHQEDLSTLFAKSSPPEEGGLRGASYQVGVTGVPLLEQALGYLECEVFDRVSAGDHTIVIGRVLEGGLGVADDPLLFFAGQYRRIGE